jgi:hypothetical protein
LPEEVACIESASIFIDLRERHARQTFAAVVGVEDAEDGLVFSPVLLFKS